MPLEVYLPATDDEIRRCVPALRALRPHLVESEILPQVRRQMANGYRLAAIDTAAGASGVAGFRQLEFLAWGRVLYIDDLITLPEARGQGLGGRLLDWLYDYAVEHGCDEVHLDSGYQRFDAHRLYLNKGLSLACHHFARKVERAG